MLKYTNILFIVFIVVVVVLWYKWHNNTFGLTAEKSFNIDSISEQYLSIDTTVVNSSLSEIAYSHFTTPNVNTGWECRIRISRDSLSYFHVIESYNDGFDYLLAFKEYIEKSVFKIKDNIIYVQDYQIEILNEDQLKVINLPEIPSGTILNCDSRHYDEKRPKFFRNWKDGKRHGIWTYIDEKGNIYREFYEHGKLLRTEEGRTKERYGIRDTLRFH